MSARLSVFLLVIGSCVASGAANAQSSWSGPYIGINGGGGWGSSSQRSTVNPVAPAPAPAPVPAAAPAAPAPAAPAPPPKPQVEGDGDHGVSGALIGGGAGYNFIHRALLLGIEGDIDWSGIGGSSGTCGGNHECGADLTWVSTVRGRAGLTFGATLVYATGGLAIGEINAFDQTAPTFSGTKMKLGWTVGGGLEQKLCDRLSAKVEYLYMDFGRADYFTLTGHTPESVSLAVHTVRVGLNYSLGDMLK